MKSPSVICEKCRKKEATVHMTKVIRCVENRGVDRLLSVDDSTDFVSRIDLCETCAVAVRLIPSPKQA